MAKTNVENLCRQWEALELELFTPRHLSPERMAAITASRPNYSEITPTAIAALKPQAEKQLMGWAHERVGVFPRGMRPEHNLAQSLKKDLAAIHSFFYGPSSTLSPAEVTGGNHQITRLSALHCDGTSALDHRAIYVMRVGSLPTQFIDHEKFAALRKISPDHMKKLLGAGQLNEGEEARRKLRTLGALVPAPLGHLMMAVTRETARYPNWHCSTRIPPREPLAAPGAPNISVFVRDFGDFPQP